MTRRQPGDRPTHLGLAAAALALAFLLVTAYSQQTERAKTAGTRREQLASLVVERQRRADEIGRDLAGLRTRLEALRAQSRAAALETEIRRLSLYAGTAPIRGPGVSVTLNDSPLAAEEDSPDFLIQDVDLQLVVNELWTAGAEAVAVNGQRIVSTTAIRSAGKAVLVNYRVLTSPYRVDAIGDPETLRRRFAESEIAERFRTWSEVYRLSIQIDRRRTLTVPAYAGSIRLVHAEPAEPQP